jgi:hypothetical protein
LIVPFPALRPTSRNFKPGDYPVKSYNAQSGAEVRILYGDTISKMEMTLGYDNVSDAEAEQFLTHYDETKGTYSTFSINATTKIGWNGSSDAIDSGDVNRWRYSSSPEITAIRPGRSSVRVNLVGVF